MKLDPRIKDRKCIFDCFCADKAKKYIGKECYLTDCLAMFEHINIVRSGILTAIDDNGLFYFGSDPRAYCLPVEFVAPKEKKFRPYTFAEFCGKFIVGRPIKFRPKDETDIRHYKVLSGYKQCPGKYTFIYLADCAFTLDELFNEYEWHEDDTGYWKPFGIEE